MNVVWKYLDKRAGAVAALKDFGSMRFIIDTTDQEIKDVYEKMGSVGGMRTDGMPHSRNLHALEDRMINVMEEIDILKERYRQAMEYMDWFLPAWEELSEDERYVLEAFYGEDNDYGSCAADMIADYFHIERASSYRKKNRAVDRLTVLLFGRP